MHKLCVGIAACAVLFIPHTSWAQSPKWEIEGHAGGKLLSAPGGGAAALPAGGDPFITIGGRPSQAVSSWYYGDGAALLNGTVGSIDSTFDFPERLVPLDSLLDEPLAEQQAGWSIGGRVAYNFTPRFAAEFNFDYGSTPWAFTDAARAGLQATSDSFDAVFGKLFQGVGPQQISSTLTMLEGNTTQATATGTLNVNLLTQGRFIPYIAGGGGVLFNRGDTPLANLEGGYDVRFVDMFPFDESDSVTLVQSIDDTAFVAVFGGGFKVFLTQSSGFRFDARVHLAKTTMETLLSANPVVVAGTPSAVFATPTVPSVQLSNVPYTPSLPSSLSGPSIDDFSVLSVSEWQATLLFSVGYFWDF